MTMAIVAIASGSDGRARLTDHPWQGWLPWGLALLIVLAAHGLTAWYLLAIRDQPIALPQGAPAILMDLAPAPSTSSASPAPMALQQASASTPSDTPPPAQTPSLHMPMTEYRQMPHPPASPGDLILPQIAADAVLSQAMKHPVMPTPTKQAKRKSVPPAVKPVPTPLPTSTPSLTSATAVSKAPPASIQPPVPALSPTVVASAASQPVASASQASPALQQQDVAATAAAQAARSSWLGEALRHIARFRHPTYRDFRKPLRVVVGFSVDRAGALLWQRVLQSSGRHDVDGDALAWISRAAPLPPPPGEISDSDLSHGFAVPVDFSPY